MKFQVGERVFVKQSLSRDKEVCCYGVSDAMQRFCGQIVTIDKAYEAYGNPATTGTYYIVEDASCWLWCDNCFEHIQPEIEDVDFDIGELL